MYNFSVKGCDFMNRFQPIAAFMDDVLVKEKGIPGCEMIVMQDHQVKFRHQSGNAQKGDCYFLYSCSKPVTTALALRLVEESKLELDAPVSQYLPAFRDLYVEKDGVKTKAENTLTVRHLFTMTGGFDYTLSACPFVQEVQKTKGAEATTMDFINAFAKRTLQFEPGTEFCYSVCHDILAGIVETIANEPFSAYAQKTFLQPLGMKNTTYRHTPEAVENIAPQYIVKDGQIVPTTQTNPYVLAPNYDCGGAGMISCAEDYILFADAMACGGTAYNGYRLLNPETVALHATPQVDSQKVQARKMVAGCPADYSYGLGVRTRTVTYPGSSPIGEYGWDGAAGAYCLIDPINRLSVFFVMHVRSGSAILQGAHETLRDLVYQALEI